MPVQKIGRDEFARLYPDVRGLTPFIGEAEEFEWFANAERNALGLIFRSSRQPIWRYAVLKRSMRGDFRVSHLDAEFVDLQSTRDKCLLAISAAESQPEIIDAKLLVPQRQPQQGVEEKHRNSLIVVLLVLAGDLVTVGIVVLLLLHWFR